MKTKLTKIILGALAVLGLPTLLIAPAFADCTDVCSCEGVSEEVKAASGCPGTEAPVPLGQAIVNILNGVIGILAVVAVVVIIVGGINYMTSAGDPGKVKKARDTILYAVIGLIICALSSVIVNFVIYRLILRDDTTSSITTSSSIIGSANTTYIGH